TMRCLVLAARCFLIRLYFLI
ncbi:hypothetical protein Pmar_PMAR004897, partial [Perkinsus marinus ATCC 50983]